MKANLVAVLSLASVLLIGRFAKTAEPQASSNDPFARENLVAWCIVPFDAAHRGPAERADMIRRLGLRRVAYDWRAEHVPTFEEEIRQYQQHDMEFFAFWGWHDDFAPLVETYGIHPQFWVTNPSPAGDTQQQRVEAAARELLPIVEKADALKCQVGLYNHGGWGGEPANLVAVAEHLRNVHKKSNVGIVYNFHHGHERIGQFEADFTQMQPYLLCLNLNGMADPQSVDGLTNKILPLGRGLHEREMVRTVQKSGYRGPIGILDHRSDVDAEQSLRENLEGLEQIVGARACP